MAWYVVAALGLCVLSLDLANEGRHDLAAGLFVLPVAYEWTLGRFRRSAGLGGLAAGCGWMSGAGLAGLAVYAAVSQLGLAIGHAFRRRWPFGRMLAALTALVAGLAVLSMAVQWEETRHQLSIAVSQFAAQMEQTDGETAGMNPAAVEQLKWMDLNWAYVGPGLIFASVLWGAAAALGFLAGLVRKRAPEAGPGTRFGEMRLPDWVVWLAIAAALLWFADRRWPNEVMRVVAWNSAMGLLSLYALNGLAIVVCVFHALGLSPVKTGAVSAAILLAGGMPLLGWLGLFDTWWDFRVKAGRWIAARQAEPPSGEPPEAGPSG